MKYHKHKQTLSKKSSFSSHIPLLSYLCWRSLAHGYILPEHLEIYTVWVRSRLTSSGDRSAEIMRAKIRSEELQQPSWWFIQSWGASLCAAPRITAKHSEWKDALCDPPPHSYSTPAEALLSFFLPFFSYLFFNSDFITSKARQLFCTTTARHFCLWCNPGNQVSDTLSL